MSEIVGIRGINKLRILMAILLTGMLAFGLSACSSSSRDGLSSFWGNSDTDGGSGEAQEVEERSYEEAIERYMVLVFEPDLAQIYEELCHENFVNRLKREAEYNELIEAEQSVIDYYMGQYEDYYGEGWTISSEIVSSRTVDGSEKIVDIYKDVDLDIEEFKEVQVARTFSSADGTLSDSDFITVYAARIGNSWYLEPLSMSGNY